MTQCTLERHRSEVGAILDPLIARLTGPEADADSLAIGDPALLGRVLAREQTARTPVPAFDNSQMDGYAVCAADLAGAGTDQPVALPLGRATAAGDPPIEHVPGTASPVMTGAAMPRGADAVVPVEATAEGVFPVLRRAGDGVSPEGRATFTAAVPAGEFVRRRAEDLDVGSRIARAGARLSPSLIGALAATGIERVDVRPRVRVLLCSTGDELDEVGAGLAPGRIHDSNTPMLAAALHGLGAETVVLRTGDTAAALLAAVTARLDEVDVVLTTGGISRGAFEVVREAFAPLGADFHAIAMQPGGPQGLGTLRAASGRAVPLLCFPGNPVSSALSCELFLAPALRRLAGRPAERETRRLPLAHDVSSPAAKHQIRRGALDAEGRVVVTAPGSHLIGDLADAELLVHLPIGVAHAAAGELVDTWRFND